MNTSKNQQAVKLIAAELQKIPENTPMEFGTLGAINGMTKREGTAFNMAKYFVKMMGGKFSDSLPEKRTEEERASYRIVKDIAASAIAICGK